MIRTPELLFLLLVFILSSCDSQRVFEQNKDLPDACWHKDSIEIFQFEINDPSLGYNLLVNLRNTSNFPFQNIYVQYQLEDSLENSLEEELMNFQLFHPQTGSPFGQSGIGDIFDHQFMILENYRFPARGKYSMKFAQMMRRDSVEDILSVGLRIEQFSEEN